MNYEETEDKDLVPAIKALQERCRQILCACTARNEKTPLEGLYRLTQPLTAESLFFEKLLNNPTSIKPKYVQSTNLSYLEAVYDAMTQIQPINDLMRAVAVPPKNGQWMPMTAMLRKQSIKVDLVTENERVWVKIIARNTKAFRYEMSGLEFDESDSSDDTEGDNDDNVNDHAGVYRYKDNFSDDDDDNDHKFGDESSMNMDPCSFDQLPIFRKARTYLTCAQSHLVHYKAPVVVFAFMRIRYNEDPFVQRIMDRLEEMGICVYLQDNQDSIRETYLPSVTHTFGVGALSTKENDLAMCAFTTSRLNLDVSTILAIISELSHHVCGVDQVDGEALQLQAGQEAAQPILPRLERILHGKELYITQTAFDRLDSIMQVVAGTTERRRYEHLFPAAVTTANGSVQETKDLWTILTPPAPVTIIPDHPTARFIQLLEPPPSPVRKKKSSGASKLNNGRRIRSKFSSFHSNIFGTADHHRMTSVTAIQWMPSALAEAGLLGSSIITHPPRSLAEQKMHHSSL